MFEEIPSIGSVPQRFTKRFSFIIQNEILMPKNTPKLMCRRGHFFTKLPELMCRRGHFFTKLPELMCRRGHFFTKLPELMCRRGHFFTKLPELMCRRGHFFTKLPSPAPNNIGFFKQNLLYNY